MLEAKCSDSVGEQLLLLVIDDDPVIRQQMRWGLMANCRIVEADDRQAALSL